MSQKHEQQKSNRPELLPPLVSAADINEANYVRARFDESIAWTITETARRRAPTSESVWSHQVGFAAELAASSYFGSAANWDIYPDYEGDDGYDFKIGESRIEVKAVTKQDDSELRVSEDKIDNADYFVLAQTTNPKELVELIGWISRPALEQFGNRFDGDVRVDSQYLSPLEPLWLPPERIRSAQE